MNKSSLPFLACFVAGVALCSAPLKAADTELKDDTGKTIIKYVVEPPANVAPAGTKDPARQVGPESVAQIHHRVDREIFSKPSRLHKPWNKSQMFPLPCAAESSGNKQIVARLGAAA